MSFAKVYGAQVNILSGTIVSIEVDISNGLHSFSIVGLPDKAVGESKDRVSSAIKNSGFRSPKTKNQKITVSLSPASLRKEGPYFDLGIALSYLLASELIEFDSEGKIFLGELGLDGTLHPQKGILPLAKEAKEKGFSEIYLSKENAKEATLIRGLKVYGAENLREVIDHLSGEKQITPLPESMFIKRGEIKENFCEIKGQETAKRGLEISAGGGHNLAMFGPPGTGKTMLAKAFIGILPDLSEEQALFVSLIHSVAGSRFDNISLTPPFRAPHHTASYVSMVGGGTYPKPGEITLAHHGVLFMDEFPEFNTQVLESLRQPLEDNIISISRAKGSAVFPSNFILIATMNPCPCGNANIESSSGSSLDESTCQCRQIDIERYQKKISGPIMDRIDLWIPVGNVDYKRLSNESDGERSEEVRKRVERAREIQRERFDSFDKSMKTNSDMDARAISKIIKLSSEVKNVLNATADKMKLSPRAYHRVIKVARTIADLRGEKEISSSHILEALQYRRKWRE